MVLIPPVSRIPPSSQGDAENPIILEHKDDEKDYFDIFEAMKNISPKRVLLNKKQEENQDTADVYIYRTLRYPPIARQPAPT